MDVLSDVLSSLRLSGAVILEGEAKGDWCVSSQLLPGDYSALLPSAEQVIAYHAIVSGRVFAQVDGHDPIAADEGSILLFPRNDRHRLFTAPTADPIDSHEFLSIGSGKLARFAVGDDGPQVQFYCGFLGVANAQHPLLDCLPPLMVVDTRSAATSEWLESNLRFLTSDEHAPETVARIAELMFAEAVRQYMDELPAGEGGWLAGLRDPAVARALAMIHKCYAEDLDVEALAKEAAVSRSVLGERFVELLGEPPMRYCARWRMRMAANMLRDGHDSTANIAYAVGFNSEAAFNRAFKREFGQPPATWRRIEDVRRATGASPLPPQVVHYCTARDGTRLAYSAVGEGPPLVKTANWLNHIEHDWQSPLWRHWIREFTDGRRLIRYDERGNGLSDWDTPELSLDAFVDDLESVSECLELDRFDLVAISQGAAVAIKYVVRHPERVRRLVICNGYAAGWAVRADPEELARREAMVTLTGLGWGSDDPTYRHLFTSHYVPGATPEQMAWFDEMQRLSASPENAVKLQRTLSLIDVRDLLGEVRTPTLIFHSRDDRAIPFEQGETLAQGIPGAMFVPLDSRNHILLDSEPAWGEFVAHTCRFLEGD